MGGRACIRGMRITVSLVLSLIANGLTNMEILSEYPDLEVEDIRASLLYAAFLANEEVRIILEDDEDLHNAKEKERITFVGA